MQDKERGGGCENVSKGHFVSDLITCSQWERTEHYRSMGEGGSIVGEGKGLSVIGPWGKEGAL